MLESTEPTVMEGTPEEIASFVRALPPHRYHVEIVGVDENGTATHALEDAIRKTLARTPEQVLADRAAILANSPKPRELPPGKTLEDVVAGIWPGQETDEEILDALKRLS